jgi:pyruvate,water dikinase
VIFSQIEMANKIWVCDDEGSGRFPVFTRGNIGEVFVEAASPLTWTAYGVHAWEPGWRDAFYEVGAFTPDEFKAPGQCEVIGCFGGYVYINMSVVRVLALRIPGMTIESIDQSFFGDYPDIPPHKLDPRDRNAERTAAVSVWLKSLFTTDPKQLTNQDRVRLDALLARRPDFTTLSDAQLLHYFRSLRSEARYLFKRHVLNSRGANVLTSLIAQITQAIGAGELAAKVSAAVGEVDSAAQSFELWELSRQVSAEPVLAAAFDQGVDGLLDRMRARAEPAAKSFLAAWQTFIDRWGASGPSVWEFRSPTYRSQPEIALRMLERARQAPDASSPRVRAAQMREEREAAVRAIAERLSGNAEMHSRFLAAASLIGPYLAARERGKFHCTLLIDEARSAVRELGQRLANRGLLAQWEHMLLATDAEADAFVANPAQYRGLIEQRAARLELLTGKEPPFVFEGDPPPLSAFKDRASAHAEVAVAGATLQGIGVSPGRYTGRARVITSLDVDSGLEPGEVIVASTTDASWGPLFLTAGAVVVETGAAISHAAIVAREIGIPAAVSVIDATRRIRDGSTISVDGNSGVVTVH